MDINIRPAEERDKVQVLDLLNLVFDRQQRSAVIRGDEYWKWKFLNSPFGQSYLSVAEQNGKIIAVSNLWPWEFTSRGKIYRALQPCDSAVHPDARGKGLFRKMRHYELLNLREGKVSVLFNFPNKQSINSYLSLGWNFSGRISWWVRLLNPVRVGLSLGGDRRTEFPEPGPKYHLDVNYLDSLAFFSPGYQKNLEINRVEGFHNYRYANHPFRKYGMIRYEGASGSSAAVFTLIKKGIRLEMVVVDMLGSEKNSLSLIREIIREARQMRVDMLLAMSNSRYFDYRLMRYGFFRKKEKNMVVLPLDTSLEHFAKGFTSWDMLACLHDSI